MTERKTIEAIFDLCGVGHSEARALPGYTSVGASSYGHHARLYYNPAGEVCMYWTMDRHLRGIQVVALEPGRAAILKEFT